MNVEAEVIRCFATEKLNINHEASLSGVRLTAAIGFKSHSTKTVQPAIAVGGDELFQRPKQYAGGLT